jgi:hypothetical protein
MAKVAEYERAGDNESTVSLEAYYPAGDPPLGVLAYDLLELDRAFRDALREARLGEESPGRTGWPRVLESPPVIRASTRSPLLIEAMTVVTTAIGTAVGTVIGMKLGSRVEERPMDYPRVNITINIDGHATDSFQAGEVRDGADTNSEQRADSEEEPTDETNSG